MDPIELDQDQLDAVRRIVNEPTRAVLNASQYGTGKTIVTVVACHEIAPEGIKLIAAPLFTKQSWKSSILRQYPDAQVGIIDGTKRGKQALADMVAHTPGWYIIGRELLVAKSVRETIAKVSPQIDVMVYDECAKWGNRKSMGFRVMKTFKPKYKMALSATPSGNKFENMFAISYWLWPQYIQSQTGRSFWSWVNKWCATQYDPFAGLVVTGELDPGVYVDQLPCYIRITKDFGEYDKFDLEVELSAKERGVYDKFQKYLIAWVDNQPIVASLPIVMRTRLRQMTLGEVYLNPDGLVDFPDDMKSTKYEALRGLMDEYPDEPMLILTHSAKYARVVTNKLIGEGYAALEWSGDVSEKERNRIKDAFIHADHLDYIVATIASIGEGTDGLQARARFLVWLSREDNGQLNEQAFRRLYRRGQENKVVSVDIVANNTYDRGQLDTLVTRAIARSRELKGKK